MQQEPKTSRFSARRAAIAAACLGTVMVLGGCNATGGALLGGWFGALIGGTADAAVAGALLGASVGAVIGNDLDHGYEARAPREYYRACQCSVCLGEPYSGSRYVY